jgi:hypothetical protein
MCSGVNSVLIGFGLIVLVVGVPVILSHRKKTHTVNVVKP